MNFVLRALYFVRLTKHEVPSTEYKEMKLTFLGTGTSTGVPSIGCECETCTSDDPHDKRLRVSVVVEHAGKTILVDTSSVSTTFARSTFVLAHSASMRTNVPGSISNGSSSTSSNRRTSAAACRR